MTLFSASYLARRHNGIFGRVVSMIKSFAFSAATHRVIDVAIVIAAFFLAIYLRLGYIPTKVILGLGGAYFLASTFAGLVVWRFGGLFKSAVAFANWRDLGGICILALIAPLTGILAGFLIDRLDAVPRSLPLYHGVILLFGLSGFRLLVMIYANWDHTGHQGAPQIKTDVLLLGHTDLASVYAEAAQAHGAQHIHIAGILTRERLPVGTLVNSTVVQGQPSDLQAVVKRLGVHGVHVSKLILLLPKHELGEHLESIIQSQNIEVLNFYEALIPVEPSKNATLEDVLKI